MTTFTPLIPRDVAARMGQEAVAIGEQGHYPAPSGRRVELAGPIARAVAGTRAYPPEFAYENPPTGRYVTQIEVSNETTLSAAGRLRAQGLNPVALNFASATQPGGGFLRGARAQEEYLARSSGLYLCIRDHPLYAYHCARPDPLYSDYMLYSPDVPVFRGDDGILLEEPYPVSIITAAAPNANELTFERRREIPAVMAQRIGKVLALGALHGHDGIVLGAWGCGAFGNDGSQIAALFRQALANEFLGVYRQVIFAIVDGAPEKKYIGPFERAFLGERGEA